MAYTPRRMKTQRKGEERGVEVIRYEWRRADETRFERWGEI
jgi:hypothetical protein